MKLAFKNIDNYKKMYQEFIGEIQPKFWFRNTRGEVFLVKRQHSEKVTGQAEKSKMYNHFGEYLGHLLFKKANVPSCPVALVTLHDTKNRYATSKSLYTACTSKNVSKPGQVIYPGEVIIAKFRDNNPKTYRKILLRAENLALPLQKGNISINDPEDNVDIVLASIVNETKLYEHRKGKRHTQEIKRDVDENIRNTIKMIVADCILGNSDRHSQNWAMIFDEKAGRTHMYPNYDNEAILGLRKTVYEMKNVVNASNNLSEYSEKELFSRMGIGVVSSGVSYKNMLEYLINKYPTYAIPAIKEITDSITEKDLEDLYDRLTGITQISQDSAELSEKDELPEEYKIFGVKLYKDRREYARNLVRKFEENIKLKRKNNEKCLVK